MKTQFRSMKKADIQKIKDAGLEFVLMENTKGIVGEMNGKMACAAVFDSWAHTSVCVHQLILNPFCIRHGFFEEVAKYVYVQADRAIMYGLVRSSNKKAIKLDLNIGFTEIARLKDGVMFGEDLVILELKKEDCRFLPKDYREAA